jgi:cell shape-determining protein MreC
MPTRLLDPVRSLSDLTHMFVTPLSHLGGLVGNWLRPPPSAAAGDIAPQELIERLAGEANSAEAARRAAEQRIVELETVIEQLQQARSFTRGGNVALRTAAIVARHPDSSVGTVQLGAGSRNGVIEGTVAVYSGACLIGRVVSVSRLRCDLLPITSKRNDLIGAAIYASDRQQAAGVEVQLVPAGDGTLTANIERNADIAVGDVARLSDSSWPEAAQGMELGLVEAIRPNDDHPLRATVVVRPRFTARDVATVTLKIETPDAGESQP